MIIDLSIVTKEWQETIDIMRQKIEADMKAMAISNKRFGIHWNIKKQRNANFIGLFHKFLQDGFHFWNTCESILLSKTDLGIVLMFSL